MSAAGTAMPLDRRSLLDRMAAQLTGTVIARGLSAVAIALLARQVGPTEFGIYAACMTLAKITSVAFALGFDTWFLRAGARTTDDNALATANGNLLAIKGGLGLVWFALLMLLAPALAPATFPAAVLALCAGIVWLEEIALIAWTTFGARLQNRSASTLLVIFQALVTAATLGALLLGVDSLATILAARLAAAAVGAAISLYWLLRRWGISFALEQTPQMLRGTSPFALSVLLSVVYGSIDVLIVAQLLGPEATGLYSPASTLLVMLYLVPTAAYSVMIPVLSRLHSVDLAQLLKSARRFQWASLALGIVMGLTLWLVAPWLVALLYGPQFAETANLLRWLSPVLALHCVSFAFGAQLTATGRQSRRLLVQAVACVVSIAGNLALLPRLGLMGAIYTFYLSEITLVLGYWLLALLWENDQRNRLAEATLAGRRA